jgi:hypothetical protein
VAETNLFKWRHYESEIIFLCVRWYLRYALSYRDPEEMVNERGLSLDHTTIYRWVQAYAPELEKRIRPHLKLTNDSYRGADQPFHIRRLPRTTWNCHHFLNPHSRHSPTELLAVNPIPISE